MSSTDDSEPARPRAGSRAGRISEEPARGQAGSDCAIPAPSRPAPSRPAPGVLGPSIPWFVALVSLLSAAAAPGQDTRLILISVDGLRPDAISATCTPNLTAMMQRGASAGRAINDLPSVTLPNHASMLTGLTSARHGVVFNHDVEGVIASETLFDHTTRAGLRGAFFAGKSKLRFLARPDALETIELNPESAVLVEAVLAQIHAAGPDVFFVHFREPDSAGHRERWMSAAYLDAVAGIDELIGRIVEAADADTTRSTYIIVTADHGGTGTNHYTNVPTSREIPWIVIGPGIRANVVLTDPVATVDTMPTALWLLGLEIPNDLSGRIRTDLKQVAEPLDPASLSVPPVGLPCLLFVLAALPIVAVGRVLSSRQRQDRLLDAKRTTAGPAGRRSPPSGSG